MVQYSDNGGGDPPRSDAERLQAALEALAARDQVLADRTRRLNALEAAAARLAALTARLEAAEEQLAALQRVRLAEVGERDARLSRLEGALPPSLPGPGAEPAAARPALPTAPADPASDALALAGRIARLEQEL
ncbi:MAG: hypothetical protein H6R33_743, partial [Actinobacteria bacterium]|nr:hypothetical protein [Actinomycetota bacterium]